MTLRIRIENGNDRVHCARGADVSQAVESLGYKGIPVGCHSGRCGACKVQVLAGEYLTGAMNRACVSLDEQGEGYALACKLIPQSDLRLRMVGKMARSFEAPLDELHFHGAASPPCDY